MIRKKLPPPRLPLRVECEGPTMSALIRAVVEGLSTLESYNHDHDDLDDGSNRTLSPLPFPASSDVSGEGNEGDAASHAVALTTSVVTNTASVALESVGSVSPSPLPLTLTLTHFPLTPLTPLPQCSFLLGTATRMVFSEYGTT